MKQKLTLFVASLAVTLGLVSVLAAPAGAINVFKDSCTGSNANTEVCKAKNDDNANALIQTIVGILLFVIGAISVIMIIVGGIKYTLANGDSSQITSAKNTFLYAIVGLIVALLAYAIVDFVLDRFGK